MFKSSEKIIKERNLKRSLEVFYATDHFFYQPALTNFFLPAVLSNHTFAGGTHQTFYGRLK